jgi:Tol biopolymer transport system component
VNKCKGEGMRNRMMIMVIVGIMLLVVGCSLFYNEYDLVRYKAPNWTDNGKIVFIKDYRHVRDKKTITGLIGDVAGSWEAYILCEIDKDGNNYTEICTLAVCKESAYLLRIDNTSSSGEWVSIGMVGGYGIEKGVYVVKRDGSGLMRVSEGTYPDLSPNADRIVYQKENEGIWIINMDGSGDHQIVSDTMASYPAWSPSSNKIAISSEQLYIVNINGTILNTLGTWKGIADWSISDSSKIIGYIPGRGNALIVSIETGEIDTLNIRTGDGTGFKWSPDGSYLIGYDGSWYVINIDGTNKWYIEP